MKMSPLRQTQSPIAPTPQLLTQARATAHQPASIAAKPAFRGLSHELEGAESCQKRCSKRWKLLSTAIFRMCGFMKVRRQRRSGRSLTPKGHISILHPENIALRNLTAANCWGMNLPMSSNSGQDECRSNLDQQRLPLRSRSRCHGSKGCWGGAVIHVRRQS